MAEKFESNSSLEKVGDTDFHESELNNKDEMTIFKVSGVLQSHENYLRFLTAIEYAGLEMYFKAFHNADQGIGFPIEPEKLYKHLQILQEDFDTMKTHGQLDENECAVLFPDSKETYTQEFGFTLFQKIIKYFYTKNGVEQEEMKINFLNGMEELYQLHINKTLPTKFQKSIGVIQETWDGLFEIFKKLDYEPDKVKALKTINLDEDKHFRYALIRSEINVLQHECDDCMKTVKTSLLALNKLKRNFEMALLESKENNNNEKQKAETELKELNALADEVVKNQNKLVEQKDELKVLIPLVKFWRQKNIEGDIIVYDEKLTQLRNLINEQRLRVGDLFNTVSFDICRIKERTSSLNGDIRVISPTPSEHAR